MSEQNKCLPEVELVEPVESIEDSPEVKSVEVLRDEIVRMFAIRFQDQVRSVVAVWGVDECQLFRVRCQGVLTVDVWRMAQTRGVLSVDALRNHFDDITLVAVNPTEGSYSVYQR